jgi:hypothetical protein
MECLDIVICLILSHEFEMFSYSYSGFYGVGTVDCSIFTAQSIFTLTFRGYYSASIMHCHSFAIRVQSIYVCSLVHFHSTRIL